MGEAGLIGMVLLAHFLAVISPGPDFAVVVRNSLMYSRRAGAWTALGIALGILVHVSYCIGGIALFIQKTPLLYRGLKLLGGLYLLYMGVISLRNAGLARDSFPKGEKSSLTSWQALQNGFLTNVLNPKATMFFLSIFSVLLKPAGVSFRVVFIAGALMILNTFLWFFLVSRIFTHPRLRAAFAKKQRWIEVMLGIILLVLGLSLLFIW